MDNEDLLAVEFDVVPVMACNNLSSPFFFVLFGFPFSEDASDAIVSIKEILDKMDGYVTPTWLRMLRIGISGFLGFRNAISKCTVVNFSSLPPFNFSLWARFK